MAQLTQPVFSINGKPLAQFTSFALNQSIFEHHQFTLVCPAQAVDGKSGIFTSSKDMIGASFGARITGVGSAGTLLFNGIITGIETSRFTGHHGDVIISGYSPTIILDSGPDCKSWEKKAIKNIAEDLLQSFPQNLLDPKVQPIFGETLTYTVQYKETAWEFLQRLTATYGEWLYWDGRNLIVGQPNSGKSVSLVYGRQLSQFSLDLQARPTQGQMVAWDYMNSQVYTSQPTGIEQKAGLNPWGEKVYQSGQTVYGTQPKTWNTQFVSNKKQQDDLVNFHSALESSKLVNFRGTSGHASIAVGRNISIKGNNVFSLQPEGYGDYLVTQVTHTVDTRGRYENKFTAVPSGIKVPPVQAPRNPISDAQSAIVTDNYDYNNLGRVRVKFHWMDGAEKTPWIRLTTPHAGNEKGMYWMPEVGEEVIVGFEGGNPTKPYVLGTVYQGQAKSSFGNAGNDLKVLQSRSGTKIIFNDAEGSVTIEDKNGTSINMDGNGKLSLSSQQEISMGCGASSFNLKQDGTISMNGKDISTTGQTLSLSGTTAISHSAPTIDVIATAALNGAAPTTTLSGSGTLNLFGNTLNAHGEAGSNISTSGEMAVSAAGNVGVSGAIVKLNA